MTSPEPRSGWLKNGNPAEDLSQVGRCGQQSWFDSGDPMVRRLKDSAVIPTVGNVQYSEGLGGAPLIAPAGGMMLPIIWASSEEQNG